MTITRITNDNYAYDLGKFGRSITTSIPETQTWFNRGLTWAYTFNHTEAAKCFEQAIVHDKSCAIAYWGLAYAHGPNFNLSWEAFGDDLKSATKITYEASRTALSFAHSATPIERALINAIQAHFQTEEPVSMEQYRLQNLAYADAMEAVYNEFGEDLDVAALTADSMMCLAPWKLWDLKTGKPASSHTLQSKEILERALLQKESGQHPGLLHLYIHLVEMSPSPELGLVPADHLRDLIPDSGHACHMPSHLDVLVGDYRAAIHANQKATIADERYVRVEGLLNFYSNYRMHNYHTLIYAAMFAGQKAVALNAVERMEGTLPKELVAMMPDYIEIYMSVRAHVMVRFGMWDDIIALPLPDDQELYCVTTATTRYAKGVAFAASGNIPEAEKQRELYHEAAKRVPTSRLDFPNRCVDVLGIAAAMLDGEIEYRRGNYNQAFKHLRHSVELDDGLGYGEPWGWMQPSRHALAALLLEQGHVEEAADIYRCDLGFDDSIIRARQHPNNVWALQGYHECLVRLGRTMEARVIETQLRIAIAVADVPVKSSCFCRKDNTQTPDLGDVCSQSCR